MPLERTDPPADPPLHEPPCADLEQLEDRVAEIEARPTRDPISSRMLAAIIVVAVMAAVVVCAITKTLEGTALAAIISFMAGRLSTNIGSEGKDQDHAAKS